VKQEITVIPQCSYTGFLALYLAVDGEPLTVDPFYLNEELCYGDVNHGVPKGDTRCAHEKARAKIGTDRFLWSVPFFARDRDPGQEHCQDGIKG
jgi:hypothetical protein